MQYFSVGCSDANENTVNQALMEGVLTTFEVNEAGLNIQFNARFIVYGWIDV